LIVGLLTETNQFIAVDEPEENTSMLEMQEMESGEMKEKTGSSFILPDITSMTSKDLDKKRITTIKKIKLETNFYNVFRNTIRVMLGQFKNRKIRENIEEIIKNPYLLYSNKLREISEKLKKLTKKHITFSEYPDDAISQISEITNCMISESDKCEEKQYCMRSTDGICKLVISKFNLINKQDNEIIYFLKMADELIRYNRISSFIFKPNSFLSFMKIKYKINSNEIILLESMITQEYFNELKSMGVNKYKMGETYDTANPLISYSTYSNLEEMNDTLNPDYNQTPTISEPTKIYNKYPRSMFPSNYQEVTYLGTHDCGLYLILYLLKKFKNEKMTISDLKELLLSEYNRYTNRGNSYMIEFISILNEEGQIDTSQLQDETMSFRELIMSEGFIPTNFDLWILLTALQIPSLFISIKFIAETRFNKREFVTYYTEDTSKMAVIIIPASFQRKRGVYPIYKLIQNETNSEKINVDVIRSSEMLDNAIRNRISIEKYIYEIYDKDNKTKYKVRKPGKRIYDELLEKEIVREERIKVSDYGISYQPGEHADRMKEMGISEEEINFPRKPKKVVVSDSSEEIEKETESYSSSTEPEEEKQKQKEQEKIIK